MNIYTVAKTSFNDWGVFDSEGVLIDVYETEELANRMAAKLSAPPVSDPIRYEDMQIGPDMGEEDWELGQMLPPNGWELEAE